MLKLQTESNLNLSKFSPEFFHVLSVSCYFVVKIKYRVYEIYQFGKLLGVTATEKVKIYIQVSTKRSQRYYTWLYFLRLLNV